MSEANRQQLQRNLEAEIKAETQGTPGVPLPEKIEEKIERRGAHRPWEQLTPENRRLRLGEGVNAELENGYFNDIDPAPRAVRKREQPQHRLMACMAANGYTVTEIAEKMEMTLQAVSNILRQPPIRQRIISMQQEAGMDELTRTLRHATTAAIGRIISRAENPQADAGLRQRADEYIVNRYLGKPKEQIEHSNKPAAMLEDAELAKIIEAGVGEIELTEEGVGAA